MPKKRKKSKNPLYKLLEKAIFSFFIGLIAVSFYWVEEKLTTYRIPQSNTPAEIYANQTDDDLRITFAKSIEDAQKSVLLIIYTLTDSTILKKLNTKAEQGIPVTVICDTEGYLLLKQKLSPKVHLVLRLTKGIMHLKILSIDDQKIWIGSANMTGESLRLHGNLVTSFDSPEMARVIRQKAAHLENDEAPPASPTVYNMGSQKVEFWFLPDQKHALNKVKKVIDSAQKTIKVAMFTFTREDLANELLNAKNRGVDVQVVIDQNQGKGTGIKIIDLFKKKGLPVRLSTCNGLLHHKFIYVDGKTLVNGSANWTARAFADNDDCFVVLEDLTEQQKKQMEKVWKVIWHESACAK